MPATVTLATTTLAVSCGASDGQISLTSTDGVFPGIRLYVDRELMTVISLGVSPWVNVRRGTGGTSGQAHNSMATVYIGRADQFYAADPLGEPPEAILVSPWINALTGAVWFAQGEPSDTGNRWWQKQTVTYDVGALGVPTVTPDITSST